MSTRIVNLLFLNHRCRHGIVMSTNTARVSRRVRVSKRGIKTYYHAALRMESGVRMDKDTGMKDSSFLGQRVSKVVAMLLVVAVVCYALAQCVINGLWFVALGVAALTACAAFGVLLILFSQRLSRRKMIDITVETTRQ